MFNLLFSIIFFNIFLIEISTSYKISDESNDNEHFKNYINQIISNMDQNSCDDINKFICNGITDDEFKNYYNYTDNPNDFYLENMFLLDHPVETEAEIKARDFYKSCKNSNENDYIDFLKNIPSFDAIKTWPLFDDIELSDSDLTKLLGQISTISFQNLIRIVIYKNHEIGIRSSEIDLKIEQLTHLLKLTKLDSNKFEIAINEFKDFTTKVNTIIKNAKETDSIKLKFNDIKNIVPNFDWEIYFKTFTHELGVDFDKFKEYSFEILNPNALKEVTDFAMDKKNRKNVINYLYSLFYPEIAEFQNCTLFKSFFRPVIIQKLLKNYSNNESRNINKKVLEIFLKEYQNFFKVNNHIDDADVIGRAILHKIQVLDNINDLYSDEAIESFYKELQVDPHSFAKNKISYVHAMGKDLLLNFGRKKGAFTKINDDMESGIGNEINLNSKNKPWLYYVVAENFDNWQDLINNYENKIKPNFESLRDCKISNDNEQLNHDYQKYIIAFNYNMKNFNTNYKEFISDLNLKEYDLNLKNLLFIGLGQLECLRNGKKEISENLKNIIMQSKGLENKCDGKFDNVNSKCKIELDI